MVAAARGKAQATFVLVHGAWHGGWCWRRVADLLEARGHKVYSPTLTGLGERSHLMSAGINLDTHIADVVNLIKWEGLDQVVLCGHSYAGWVISGVAEEMQERIASIVFLDAFMPENGQKGLDLQTPEARAQILEAVREGRVSRSWPAAIPLNVAEENRAWVASRLTLQPIGVTLQPIRLSGARDRIAKKAYIRTTRYEMPAFDQFCARLRADPSWRVFQMDCGHDAMVDMPEALADILLQAV